MAGIIKLHMSNRLLQNWLADDSIDKPSMLHWINCRHNAAGSIKNTSKPVAVNHLCQNQRNITQPGSAGGGVWRGCRGSGVYEEQGG